MRTRCKDTGGAGGEAEAAAAAALPALLQPGTEGGQPDLRGLRGTVGGVKRHRRLEKFIHSRSMFVGVCATTSVVDSVVVVVVAADNGVLIAVVSV